MSASHSRGSAERRRFRRIVAMSAGCHLLAVAILGFAPSRRVPLVAPVISVDLLASLPQSGAPTSADKFVDPAAKPRSTPPKVKKIVLPKKAPSATRKPRTVGRPPKRVKPKELDYGDALAKLRNELGESETPEVLARAEPSGSSGRTSASRLDPAVSLWLAQVKRHVRKGWVIPQEFLDRELETRLVVDLAADGRLRGQPRVARPSGDPFWDDSVERAILRAAPLPPPPEPGIHEFSFSSRSEP